MNLAELLSLEQIVPKLSAADRWSVLDQLVDVLVRSNKVPPQERETVRKAVKDREAGKNTGIGYGIALPHASVGCVQSAVAAFARLNPGVDFQAMDSRPVTLCLLFLTPQGQFQQHLYTLSSIARFLNDKDRREKLETAQTREEMLAIFASAA